MKTLSKFSRKATTLISAALILAGASMTLSQPAAADGYYAGHYAYVQSVTSWDKLNIRKWPASHSRKVGSIPSYGDGIWVQRCIIKPGASDWCKIHFAGKWGWVNSRYLGSY